MIAYMSPETRHRVEAAVEARRASFILEYTTLTAIVISAFEWFFEGERPLSEAVAKLKKSQAGNPPFNKSITLEAAPASLVARFDEIPRGRRAMIADAVIATWMHDVLPTL